MEGHVTLANKRIPYKSIPVNKPIETHLQSINTDAREAHNRVPILFHKEKKQKPKENHYRDDSRWLQRRPTSSS